MLARRNKSLGWLAERAGVTQSYLSQWLSGAKCPCPTSRKKILRALGCSWDDIFRMDFKNE